MQNTNQFRTLDASAPRSEEDRLKLANWFCKKAEEAEAGAAEAHLAGEIKTTKLFGRNVKRYRETEKKWRDSIG